MTISNIYVCFNDCRGWMMTYVNSVVIDIWLSLLFASYEDHNNQSSKSRYAYGQNYWQHTSKSNGSRTLTWHTGSVCWSIQDWREIETTCTTNHKWYKVIINLADLEEWSLRLTQCLENTTFTELRCPLIVDHSYPKLVSGSWRKISDNNRCLRSIYSLCR